MELAVEYCVCSVQRFECCVNFLDAHNVLHVAFYGCDGCVELVLSTFFEVAEASAFYSSVALCAELFEQVNNALRVGINGYECVVSQLEAVNGSLSSCLVEKFVLCNFRRERLR